MNTSAINRFIVLTAAVAALLFIPAPAANAAAVTIDDLVARYYQNNGILVLCYHDVYQTNIFDDNLGTSVQNLEDHLQYLKDNNYNVITLEQYINYIEDKDEVAPPKTIMLSFDDGYESAYSLVFPLLKKFNFPAMFAVVGSWVDGSNPPEGKSLATLPQLREMEASGLAEIVSHSYDLHYYEVCNPYGDYFPAANTRVYENGRYEEHDAYIERITRDFENMAAHFEEGFGRKPRAIAWPYGECNAEIVGLAKSMGARASFVLVDNLNIVGGDLPDYAKRYMMHDNFRKEEFAAMLSGGQNSSPALYDYTRASQVDIDNLYEAGDIGKTDKNIDALIKELVNADVNTVFLQAFADNEGSGNIKSVYFYTGHAPVEADIFSHVASRLREEGFSVIAWMNTLSCQWLIDSDKKNMVKALYSEEAGWYDRATPFSLKTWELLSLLFDDLSLYSKFDGILFQDDLYLNDYEDFSSWGIGAFSKKFNTTLDKNVLADKKLLKAYGEYKTKTLIGLTNTLMQRVRKNIPYAVSMRNIYSDLVTSPESETWYAQNYKDFINNYDYTVIMAYPYLEKRPAHSGKWMSRLVGRAIEDAGSDNLQKIIVKVQTYDWTRKKWLSNREISGYLRLIEDSGLKHSAMYPHKRIKRR